MICNRGVMASILGISEPTLDTRVRLGMPGAKKGNVWEFDTAKVIAYLQKQAGKTSEPSKKASVELRIAEAEAEIKEYKVGEMRKQLVAVDDIEELFEERLTVFKSQITALPARVAQLVAVTEDPAEVLRILKAEVAEALDGMGNTVFPDPDKRHHGFYYKGEAKSAAPEEDEDDY